MNDFPASSAGSSVPHDGPRERMSLNGVWEFEQTRDAFPPVLFGRKIPVPGLVHLAEPRMEDYDRFFSRPEDAGGERSRYLRVPDYTPRYSWYRKRVFVPGELAGRECVLSLRKSMFVTEVFVNGVSFGSAMECYTPIEHVVTRALRYGQENEILVRLGDRFWLPDAAAGSTDQEKAHYLPGIWDDVDFIFTGPVRVERALFLPNVAEGGVRVRLRLHNHRPQQYHNRTEKTDAVQARVEVFDPSGVMCSEARVPVAAERGRRTQGEVWLPLPDAHLWTPEDPALHTGRITLYEESEASDVFEVRFGMRDFTRRGKAFYLNSKRIYLRGANLTLHRFFEDPECRDLPWNREWVTRLLKTHPQALNWNAMRVSVGLLPDFWYEIADANGLLLQNEWCYWQSHGWDDQIRKEFTEWLWADGNHPSIVIWDAINENWDDYIANRLIPDLRELDSTRVWDAGYMTEVEAPQDEMDEPHPYEGYWPWRPENFEDNPYPLGDLDYRNEMMATAIASGTAQIVNEYGWVWLWRDGQPTPLTREFYQYYLGDITNPDLNREFQAYWLQCETEWLRSMRSIAGVFAFTYLTNNFGYTGDWFVGGIGELRGSPVLSWFRHAFAPTAVFINLPDGRYLEQVAPWEPGSRLHIPLRAINDRDAPESGRASLRLLDSQGAETCRQELDLAVEALGQRSTALSLDLPEKPGGYLLLSEFRRHQSPEKPQISRRYLKVGMCPNYQFFQFPP